MSVFTRPTAVGGAPEPGKDPEQRSREATNRCIAANSNAIERSRRQILVSQEAIAEQVNDLARTNGHAHTAQVVIAEEIAEVQKDHGVVQQQQGEWMCELLTGQRQTIALLKTLMEHLSVTDYVEIPKEERVYTFDPDEEL